MSKLLDGFNADVSNEDYHGDREYSSSSVLKTILRDPEKYYKKYVLGEEINITSKAMEFGTYLHTLLLEPENLDDECAVYPGPVRRGKAYDEFLSLNPGKIIITKSQADFGDQLIENVRNHPASKNLFTEGKAEQTLCAEIDGIKIKVRCDYLKGNKIIDLKTTGGGVTYDEIVNTCLSFDYDLSAALYCDAFEQVMGYKHDFYFVFTSKKTQQAETIKASEQFLDNGRRKYKEAIRLIKEGRKTGVYFDPEAVKEIFIPDMCIFRGGQE